MFQLASIFWNTQKNKLIISLFIFAFAILIGYAYQSFDFDPIDFKKAEFQWCDYYLNNLKVAIIIIIAGFISYGVASSVLLFLNGLVIGVGVSMIVNNNPSLFWKSFLPHAVFELPAIIVASVVPFILWRLLFTFKKGKKPFLHKLKFELFPALIFIIITLFIASLIEAFFSSLFV